MFFRFCPSESLTLTFLLAVAFLATGIQGIVKAQPDAGAPALSDTGILAGAAIQRIDPTQFPVWVSGGIVAGKGERVVDSLNSRALVLQSQGRKVAICVVDSLGLPAAICSRAKEMVQEQTGIPPEHILISATHTHSAPAVMGAHGTPVQEDYAAMMPGWIADSIREAHSRLQPARVGIGITNADRFIYCRRWIMEPDHAANALFNGRDSNIAMMNPGHENPFKIRQTAEVDRTIPMLSVQDLEGRPMALLASFCTHYAGAPALSSDYFGVVANELASSLRPDSPDQFVGIMANGNSGDANCIDFSRPAKPFHYREVGQYVASRILESLPRIRYETNITVNGNLEWMTASLRTPSLEETREAQAYIDAKMGDRLPSNLDENYARETVLLAQGSETRSIPIQAIEVGDLVIAATPTETFNATGLSVRAKSPYAVTMNIGLANDLAGYLPPADQFELGGYTTWRARSSCLAIDTEAKVVDTLNDLIQRLYSAHPFNLQAQNRGAPEEIEFVDSSKERSGPDSIVAPHASLACFELEPGQRISLVACEPQIVDPVALRFDDSGDLWVVEMRDYPDRAGDSWQGRIRVLRDQDFDGFYETSRTFADGLAHPTGIQWTRSGVLVTLGGSLVRMQDTDGDGIADQQEVLLSGFAEENTQLRVNDPEIGLDGKLALANGLRSSRVQVTKGDANTQESQWVDISNGDVALDLRNGQAIRISGPSQYGLTWDRYGNRYGCNNRNPCDEVLVEAADSELSPLAGLAPMVASVLPPGDQSRVRPLVDAWTTSNLHEGQFTAACGVLISDSHHLPGASLGHALTCEPTGSLIHRVAIGRVQGKSQTEEPDRGREWLASRDPWFRPVFLEEGPDGAIYITDMYRAVIEHPDWVPDELKHRPDQRWGEHAGRIYRVGRNNKAFDFSLMKELRNRPLGNRTTQELVSVLSHPNDWMRRTAAQLLDERVDDECAELLISHCMASKPRNANGLLRALHSLARRKALSNELVAHLLGFPSSDSPGNTASIHDPSLRAAIWRAARSIEGAWSPDLRKLAESAIRYGHREEMLAAAWAVASRMQHSTDGLEGLIADSLLQACVERSTEHADDPYAWMGLSAVCRSRWLDFSLAWGEASLLKISQQQLCKQADWETWARSIAMAADPDNEVWRNGRDRWWTLMQQHMAMSASTTEAERRTRDEPTCRHMLAMAMGILDSKDRAWLTDNGEFWQWLVKEAQREDRTSSVLRASIALLASAPESVTDANKVLRAISEQTDAPKFTDALKYSVPSSVQLTAFQAWAKRSDPSFAEWVVERYPQVGPELRQAMWQSLRSSPQRMETLIRAVETERLSLSIFDAVQLQILREATPADLKTVVDRWIDSRVDRNRQIVIDRYAGAISPSFDTQKGKGLFLQRCAPCHRVDGVGEKVGPDISDTRTQTPMQLLIAILDPHRAVDQNYFQTAVRLTDGTVIQGIVVEESARHVVLKNQQSPRMVIEKESVETMVSTGKSLMPDGIEVQIDESGMNDLIGYLKNWRYNRSEFQEIKE